MRANLERGRRRKASCRSSGPSCPCNEIGRLDLEGVLLAWASDGASVETVDERAKMEANK